jgi:hypothetical protein
MRVKGDGGGSNISNQKNKNGFASLGLPTYTCMPDKLFKSSNVFGSRNLFFFKSGTNKSSIVTDNLS